MKLLENQLLFAKVKEGAIIPTKTEENAGRDLYACFDEDYIVIHPLETKLIPTGIATEIPQGYFGGVFPRSGLATKQGLRLANCVGVIDADYRGEWFIPIYNDTDVNQIIKPNERIAQMIIIPFYSVDLEEVEELNDTERGDGGFGSTGDK